MNQSRITWLDSLKFFACICVFSSHFFSVFPKENLFSVFNSVFKAADIFLNGNLWVSVFCIISGYFSSKKNIDSFISLFKAIIKRYLRFVIPFISFSLILCILYAVFGCQLDKYAVIFSNSWMESLYGGKIYVTDLLKSIFLFDSKLNTVMWTIRPIFWGNCLIFGFSFLFKNTEKQKRVLIAAAFSLVAAVVTIIAKSTIFYSIACFSGYFLDEIIIIAKKLKRCFVAVIWLFLFAFYYSQNSLVDMLSSKISIPFNLDYLYQNTCWNYLFALIIVILIGRSTNIKKFIDNKVFNRLSKFSFDIYILHCPVIFSFSFFILGYIYPDFSMNSILIILTPVTILFIMLISFIKEKTFGKVESALAEIVIKKLKL